MTMTTPLLRVAELAERLGWRAQRIYRMAAKGELPHLKMGREVWFEEAQIAQWIAAHRVQGRGVDAIRMAERQALGLDARHLFS